MHQVELVCQVFAITPTKTEITETFKFCLMLYLYSMFQPSPGSSLHANEKNNQNVELVI